MPFVFRFLGWPVLAGLLLAGLAAPSQAGLVYDLRFATTQPGTVNRTNAKNVVVTPTATGAVVSIELWATITGATDGSLKSFSTGQGSFVSSAVGGNSKLHGDLRGGSSETTVTTVNNISGYNSTGATSGFMQDLNADGDLDVGNLINAGTGSSNTWFLAAAAPGFGTPGPAGPGLDANFLIGTTTFTITDAQLLAGDLASINFVPRLKTSGTSTNLHRWYEDGTTLITALGNSPLISVGSALTIGVNAIPEPSTMALGGVLLAGLAGMQLRRKKA